MLAPDFYEAPMATEHYGRRHVPAMTPESAAAITLRTTIRLDMSLHSPGFLLGAALLGWLIVHGYYAPLTFDREGRTSVRRRFRNDDPMWSRESPSFRSRCAKSFSHIGVLTKDPDPERAQSNASAELPADGSPSFIRHARRPGVPLTNEREIRRAVDRVVVVETITRVRRPAELRRASAR